MNLKDKGMAFLCIMAIAIPLVVVCGMILHSIDVMYRSEINNWAVKNNMEVSDIEERYFNIGPFWFKDKNQRVYKVTMTSGRVMWMRTGVFGNDWLEDE